MTGADRRERADTQSSRVAGTAVAAGVVVAAHSDMASARWPFRSREKASAATSELQPSGPAATYPAKPNAPVRVAPLERRSSGLFGASSAKRAEAATESSMRTAKTVSDAWSAATAPGQPLGTQPASQQASIARSVQAIVDPSPRSAGLHRTEIRPNEVRASKAAAVGGLRKPREPVHPKLTGTYGAKKADAQVGVTVVNEATKTAADASPAASTVAVAAPRDGLPSREPATQITLASAATHAPDMRRATPAPQPERGAAIAAGGASDGKTNEMATLAATPDQAEISTSTAADGISWSVVAPVVGLLATSLLVPALVQRKRRKAQMNTPTRTPSTDAPPRVSKVRMFSSTEIWPPNHATHRGPWEAPAETESFAHLYRVGTNAALDLLFVDEQTALHVGAETLREADHRAAVFNGMHLHAPILDGGAASRGQASDIEPVVAAPGISAAVTSTQDDVKTAAPLSAFAAMESAGALDASGAGQAAPIDAIDNTVVAKSEVPPSPLADEEHGHAMIRVSGLSVDSTAATRAIEDAGTPVAQPRAPAHGVAVIDPSSLFVGADGAASDAREDACESAPTSSRGDAGSASNVEEPTAVEPMAARIPEAVSNAPAHEQACVLAEPQPVAEAPAAPRRISLERIRKMVDEGAYREALDALAAWQSEDEAPSEVWMLAAWAWWRVASTSGRPEAYREAAEAMEQLLVHDGSQPDVWYRAGTCRLLQAEGEQGDARTRTLDTAIAALRRALEGGATPEVNVALGDALYQRALSLHESRARNQALTEATEALRSAMRHSRDAASPAAWKLQEVLQARARMLTGEAASRLRLEADALLEASLLVAPADQRGAWYAAKVENELAHAELAEGATRMLHLRRFRAGYQDALTGPDATPDLLLSWLELIALETAHLRGAAAMARFDEGMAILDRVDAMLPKNPHVAFARARLLRRRGRHAGDSLRLAATNDAYQTLAPFLPMHELHDLRLEAVDVLLERAALLSAAQAEQDWQAAEGLATPLIDDPLVGARALRAVLDARLARSNEPAPLDLVQRLAAAAAHDPRACWTLAQATMRVRQPQSASEYCAAAVRAGLQPDAALKVLWARANREWAELLRDPAHDPAWQANRKALRAIA